MDDKDRYCQNHPQNPVTARCLKFNRRFCDLDFELDAEEPARCLSEGTFCEYRSQCMVWEKLRERKRKLRKLQQEKESGEDPLPKAGSGKGA